MFKDISNCVDFEQKNPFLTLISSACTSDSSFLIHHFISYALKSKKHCYFLNLSQTWSHYKSVQSKLGNTVLLNESIEKSLFQNIDFVKQTSVQRLVQLGEDTTTHLIEQLFNNFFASLTKNNSESIVIIDDLSILNLLGLNENYIFKLIYKIRSLNSKVNLIIQMQSFTWSTHLLNDLARMSEIYFKIEDLVTGYSKDIQGQVRECYF